MKKIMMGVSLGLAGMAGMSQAQAWSGGIEGMRTMQDNTSGQVVRVKSSTTDCCTLRPMKSHGHAHQRKIIHHGQVYYCTRVAGHGKQVSHHGGKVKQHYQRQTQHAVNAQRAKRQAMFAAQAKRKALLLAQQRQRAAHQAAQKRKNILLAQQKQRAAHQALMQAQQRKRAAQQLQQQRKLQLLAQQRRQAAQQKRKLQLLAQQRHVAQPRQHVAVVKPQPRYHQPQPRQHTVVIQQRHSSGYQRSKTIRMQPIQNVMKRHAPQRSTHRFSGQQSVDHHDARMYQQRRVAQIRAAQMKAQQHHYAPAQQSVARHDAAQGWQRAATVQSHGVRHHQNRQVVAMANTHQHQPDCGC